MAIRFSYTKLAQAGKWVLLTVALIALLTTSIQAQAKTWYVNENCSVCGDGTMDRPFQTIREALAAADDGDTLLVAQGTYTENLVIDAQVELRGGFRADQPTWIRNVTQYETIIASGDRTAPGTWNGDWLGSPCVLKDAHAYRMWYSAGSEFGGERIGYADSPNGIHWFHPYSSPLLSPGSSGAWDEAGVMDPTVLVTGIGAKMWYVGTNASGERAIGYASSSDGLTWRKHGGNPVLRPDPADATSFGFPTVLRNDSGNYDMWYSGGDRIWLATSPDGLNWTKHQNAPSLAPGASGAWDDKRVYTPIVLANSGQYEMWYTGQGKGTPEAQVGHAWSRDGRTWTKSPANPVLVAKTGYWEQDIVAHPAIVKDGAASYKMWYQGGDAGGQSIGHATSSDGLNWDKYDDNPVFARGRATQWGMPVVLFGTGSDGAVLDGFTIQNGDAEYGGGIFVYETSPTIRACRITGNTAYRDGGGIWLGDATPTIDRTTVDNNTSYQSGGGIAVSYASPTLRNSSIVNNVAQAYGGGLAAGGSSQPAIETTVIAHNTARWGGGLYAGDEVNLDVSSVRIDGNVAQQAGGIRVVFATLTMTNTFVVDNRGTVGGPGGMQFWYASGRLVNVTVAGNSANDGLGGILFGAGRPAQQLVILNSVLFFNGDHDVHCSGGSCTVTYSDVSQGISSPGNISADPVFVNRLLGDYHLRAGSPAIDAGTSEGAPAVDFEGDPRPVGAVDMGADEF